MTFVEALRGRQNNKSLYMAKHNTVVISMKESIQSLLFKRNIFDTSGMSVNQSPEIH